MKSHLLALLLVVVLVFAGGCGEISSVPSKQDTTTASVDTSSRVDTIATTTTTATVTLPPASVNDLLSDRPTVWEDIPAYEGDSFSLVLDGRPYFTANTITTQVFELYSDIDTRGRCGFAFACCGTALMPTGSRGDISSVKPSGWKQAQYDFVDGEYLYNRCHLIGWQLSGEDANKSNLITGTRYMNTEGMLPFENMVADYIKETDHHVMYRVTPWFYGNELVARGVQIEAYSVEDNGEGICFNVFCHNVQPGVTLNYADGSSALDATTTTTAAQQQTASFVLNTNTKRIHRPDCRSVNSIKAENRRDFNGTLSELQAMGYSTCGNCF